MKNQLMLLVTIFAFLSVPVLAQPPQPPPPKEYDVQIRYRIQAARNDRVPQFFAFLKQLDSLGFQHDADITDEAENPLHDRISGRIAGGKVRDLFLAAPVRSLLLYPSGYRLPQDLNTPVKVRLELASGRPLDSQHILYDQVRDQLGGLGYREPVLYDHRGYTRLVGTVPAGNVPDLFKDLRNRPDGWFAPLLARKSLPSPLREVNSPIRIAEVTPEPEGVAPVKELPAPPEIPKGQEKLSADLRERLGKEDKPRRIEVVLLRTPLPDARPWQTPLLAASPDILIEGRAGQVASILATPEQALALAASPHVVSLRLARTGAPLVPPPTAARGGDADLLSMSGLSRLHSQGFRGQGVRVAVIAGDFRGYEALKGEGRPRTVRVLDLTRERDPHLEAEPESKEEGLGYGTHGALAVMRAAPDAELLLIRVDPAALPHVLTVAQAINGDPLTSDNLTHRRDELDLERRRIAGRWDVLLKERKQFLDHPPSADELDPDAKKAREAFETHNQEIAKLKAEEKLYRESNERYLKLLSDLRDLQRVQVVVCTLYWPDSYPVDGSSPLSRYLDDHPFRGTWWFQAAGDTRGQSWTGLFRDSDNNAVMEFAPEGTPLRRERWTPEVNFLAWHPFAGPRQLDLPAKTTLRISVQWREAHDPSFLRNNEDPYGEPLTKLRLVLLRQRDPSGKQLPADEMAVVARSFNPALRLSNAAEAATYEQVLEFTTEEPGRYALRVEGVAPGSTRPVNAPTLPEQKATSGELRLRLFLDVADAANRAAGRAVFLDYVTGEGDITMPGDAVRAVTVGAADRWNLARPYSAAGPALNLELLRKPNVLAYDGLELEPGKAIQGTGVAAAFAGGLAATVLSNGAPPQWFRAALPSQPESILQVPERWQGYRPAPRR